MSNKLSVQLHEEFGARLFESASLVAQAALAPSSDLFHSLLEFLLRVVNGLLAERPIDVFECVSEVALGTDNNILFTRLSDNIHGHLTSAAHYFLLAHGESSGCYGSRLH